VLHIHVSYLPVPHHIGEPKTKPTQISVKLLNSMGIQPHFIVARSRERIDKRRRERFALFTNVQPEHIIDGPDVPSVYEIPLIFKEQEFDDKILLALGIEAKEADLKAWNEYVKKVSLKKSKTVKVGIVGKYFATGKYDLKDSYAALFDALDHAATNLSYKLDIKWINSETFEKEDDSKLEELDGIIVPIGWGARGVMGKIKAIKYARENKVPYLGLCYGMQLAVVEFARNVLGWKTAQSTEVEEGTNCPVVHIIPDQKRIIENRAYGGTMRLGSWDCIVKEDTICFEAYEKSGQFVDKNKKLTSERHRHRYEFNNQYEKDFEDAGMVIAGKSVKENLVELIELPKKTHPFFVGTQGHPEYKSRPLRPHGLFLSFLTHAAKDRL
jgi:CTP synthase